MDTSTDSSYNEADWTDSLHFKLKGVAYAKRDEW
jgi:hypothetical protein